ncbi:hypothetical protein F5X99DRAFT_404226, partial [Biscogniauxia marginata]
MVTIAITGASGKLGGATLSALLSRPLLLPPSSTVIALTSSHPGSPTWAALSSSSSSSSSSRHGPAAAAAVQIRHASFDSSSSSSSSSSASSFADALRGVDKLFLVSTPRIELDFNDAPPGRGREAHHEVAIDAAVAAGVRHIYYSSLAFA